jgi:hypothetical protein
VLTGQGCWEECAEKGETEGGEGPLDSEAVSQFCSDSPSPEGRGWRQLLAPLLFWGVLSLGQ